MSHIATEKLWLTADRSRLVKDGDPEAAFLFCTPGKALSDEDAKRYGLKAKAKPANKEAEAPENKSGSGVTVTKADRTK